jgi:hypothetical protein
MPPVPEGADLSVAQELCWRALILRRERPASFNLLERKVHKFVRDLEAERERHIRLSVAKSEQEQREDWRKKGLLDESMIPVHLGRLCFGDLGGGGTLRSYLGTSGEAYVRQWGQEAQIALLEFAVFLPHKDVLEHETETLVARPDYSWFWCKVALDFEPRDEEMRNLMLRVLRHTVQDSNRNIAYRAIALDSLARHARTPGEAQLVVAGADSEDDAWRGISLHALATWVSEHPHPADEALKRAAEEAEEKIKEASATETVPWIKEACKVGLLRIRGSRKAALEKKPPQPREPDEGRF